MALPKVKTITYNVKVEELNKEIKYRPMLVGEQKILITAIELQDPDAIVNAIVNIVDSCTFNALDMKNIPMHLVDWLYVVIFSKSVSETSDASFTCTNKVKVDPNEVDDEYTDYKDCGFKFTVKIPLNDAKVKYPENFKGSEIVMIDDNVGIKLKVPSLEDYSKINIKTDAILDVTEEFIFACIDSVFDATNVSIPGKDFSPTEFKEWLNQVEANVVDKIGDFFKNLPIISLDMPIKCPSCKSEHVIKLRGLEDFFV